MITVSKKELIRMIESVDSNVFNIKTTIENLLGSHHKKDEIDLAIEYSEGGIVPHKKWNQKKYEERMLKLIMKDKPPGFMMHHPFTREWIMKKPIPKTKRLNKLNKGGKEMKKEKIKKVSTKEKLEQLIKKLKEPNTSGVPSLIDIEFTKLGPISFCFLTDLNRLPNAVSLGIAVCSNKDSFTKSESRYIALKRAYRSYRGRDKTIETFSLITIKNLQK